MLLYISGSLHSGKTTLIQYFINQYNFTYLTLNNNQPKNQFKNEITFNNYIEFFNFITINYNQNYVFDSTLNIDELSELKKRPYFYFIWLEAPTSLRYERYRLTHPDTSIDQFVELGDSYLYDSVDIPLYQFMNLSDLTIHNPFKDILSFHNHIDSLQLLHPDRLRPSWDTYFILLTQLASLRSNCMKRRVGCIIVKDNRVIATGYNGTPKGVVNCNEGGCNRCNTNGGNLDSCICIHAEENAMLEAGRERTSGGNCILYCNTCPCLGCTKKIIQMGIREVVYSQTYKMDNETTKLFELANIKLRKHLPSDIKLFVGI